MPKSVQEQLEELRAIYGDPTETPDLDAGDANAEYVARVNAAALGEGSPVLPPKSDRSEQLAAVEKDEIPEFRRDIQEANQLSRAPQQDLPIPANWNDLLASHTAHGRPMDSLLENEELRKASSQHGNALAYQYLVMTGLMVDGAPAPGVTEDHVRDLSNAFRYNAMLDHAPMTEAERPAVIRDSGVTLFEKAKRDLMARLEQMDPQSEEAVALQQDYAKAHEYQSLVAQGHPRTIVQLEEALVGVQARLNRRRSPAAARMAMLPWGENADREFKEAHMNLLNNDEFNRGDAYNEMLPFLDRLYEQLETLHGAQTAIDAAFTGTLQRHRALQAGVPPAVAGDVGPLAKLGYTHTALSEEAARLSVRREMGDLEVASKADAVYLHQMYRDSLRARLDDLVAIDANALEALDALEIRPEEPLTSAALARGAIKVWAGGWEGLGEVLEGGAALAAPVNRWANDIMEAGSGALRPDVGAFKDQYLSSAVVARTSEAAARAELEMMRELDGEATNAGPESLATADAHVPESGVPWATAAAFQNPEGEIWPAIVASLAPNMTKQAARATQMFPRASVIGETIFADVTSGAFKELPGADVLSEESVRRQEASTSVIMQQYARGEASASDVFWAVGSLATLRYGREVREGLEMAFARPKEFGRIATVGFVVGPALASPLLKLRSATLGAVGRRFKNRRTRHLIARAAYSRPETLADARRFAHERLIDAPDHKVAEAYDSLGNHLESLERLQRDMVPGGSKHIAQVNDISRRTIDLQKELKFMGDDELRGMAHRMGLGEEVAGYVDNFRLESFLHDAAQAVKEDVFQLGKLHGKGILANSSDDVARFITSKVDADGKLPTDLPDTGLSVDGLDMGGRWLSRKFAQMGVGDTTHGRTYRALVRWWAAKKEATVRQRAFVAETRNRQDNLMSFVQAKAESAAAAVQATLKITDAPEAVAELQAALKHHQGIAKRVANHRANLRRAPWQQDVALSRVDYIADDDALSFMDLAMHLEAGRGEPLGIQGLYARLGNRGETFGAFRERWNALVRGDDVKAQSKMKRLILREYYNTRGTAPVRLDKVSGKLLTGNMAKNLAHERRKALDAWKTIDDAASGAEVDPKALARAHERVRGRTRGEFDEATLGIEVVSIKRALRDLKRIANANEAARVVGIEVNKNGVDDGRMGTALRDLYDKIIGLRLSTVARRKQVERLSRAIARNPEVGELLGRAIEKAHEVGLPDMDSLRLALPEEFGDLPTTHDEHVNFLLQFEDSFRRGLLEDLVAVGRFTPAEAADASRPFKPVRYRTKNGKIEEIVPVLAEEKLGASGGDSGLFELQRDPTHYRVVLHREGQGAVNESFASQADAIRWVEENYGRKGSPRRGDGQAARDVTFKSGTDNRVDIIAPMGEDWHRRLLPNPTEASVAQRLAELVDEVSSWQYLTALDRPGWAYDDTKAALRAGITDDELASDWVTLPDNKAMGPLRGKVVHKNVRKDIDAYYFHVEHVKNFVRAIEQDALEGNALNRALAATASSFTRVGHFMKDAIVTNMIGRSGVTQLMNVMSDVFIFAHGATNGGIQTPAGRKMLRKAVRLLREDWGSDGAMSEDLMVAIKHGGIDETIMGNALDAGIRRDILEIVHGKPGTLTEQLSREWDRFRVGLGYGKAEDIPTAFRRATMADIDDPQLESIYRDWESVEDTITKMRGGEIPWSESRYKTLLAAKRSAEQKIRAAEPTLMNSVRRAARMLQHIATGRKGGHFGEREIFSRALYGQVSNVSRLGSFLYLWKVRGMSPEAAGDTVSKFMQTFSRTSSMARKLSRSGVMNPVAGFLLESGRIAKNNALHNSPFAAAFLTAIPAINFQTMAMMGINPYDARRSLAVNDPRAPAWMQFATGLVLPSWDGDGINMVTIPGLNLLLPLKAPVSAMAALARLGEDPSSHFEPTAWNTFVRNPFSHLFQGTALNLAVAAYSGRDPETGAKYKESRGAWFSRLPMAMLNTMVPPSTPFIGSRWRRAMEIHEQVPRTLTQAENTVAQSILDPAGFRLRTDLGQARQFAMAVKRARMRGDGPRSIEYDPKWQEYRTAGWNLMKAREAGDAEAIEAAEAEVQKIEDELVANAAKEQQLLGVSRKVSAGTKTRLDLRERMLDSFDPEAAFQDLDLTQKVDVILEMHPGAAQRNQDLMRWLVQHTMRRGEWAETQASYSNPERIADARDNLGRYLQAPRSTVALEELRHLQRWLADEWYAADQREREKAWKDSGRLEAHGFLPNGDFVR